MKHIIYIVLALIFASDIYAQKKVTRSRSKSNVIKWLSISAKGGYGNSILLNSSVMNDDDVNMNFLSPSFSYGGRLGITFGDYVGVSGELLSYHFGQKYTINSNNQEYTKETKLVSTDFSVLLRYTSAYGIYVEAGPKFSTLKSVNETNSIDVLRIQKVDDYNEKFKGALFGLGMAPLRRDRVELFMGLRFNYGFDDLLKEEYVPLFDGVKLPVYANHESTNPLSVQLMIEFNYIFGFWGDASCKKGRIVFFQ